MPPLNRYFRWKQKNGEVEIRLSVSSFAYEPLLATRCSFMDAFYCLLDKAASQKSYLIILSGKQSPLKKKDARRITGEFYNEFLHNLLRYRIASRNQKVREMIVREALFFSLPKKKQSQVARQLQRQESIS